MKLHATTLHPRWRRRLHARLRRAGVPDRPRARAGRVVAQPGRAVSGRRQRRAQHAGALQDPRLLQPSAHDRRAGGPGAAGRAPIARRALGLHPRLAGLRADLQRGAARDHAADRLPELEPLALPGHRHLGTANPANSTGHRAGWAAISTRCRRRSIRWRPGTRRARRRARCVGTHGGRAGDSERGTYAFASPNAGVEATARTRGGRRAWRRICRADRPHLAFVNGTHAGRPRDARPRGGRGHATAGRVTYPNNGFAQALQAVAGAMVARHRHAVFWVQTGGYDTHAQTGTPANGAYANLMGTLDDGAGGVLHRPAQPGPAQRHDGAAVLGVRPAHLRERQQRHRPRRGRRDDGARRRVRGGLYGTAASLDPTRTTRRSRTTRGDVRYETDFRVGLRARARQVARRRTRSPILGGDFRAGAPAIF